MGKVDRAGGGGEVSGALLAAPSPSRRGMEGGGPSEEPSRRGRSGCVRLHKMWVRKPHVGATRGGRSCASGRGQEDPAELKAESGPQNASSSPGRWGNPSVRRPRPPALSSLSFPCPGGGRGSRAEPGARRGRSGPRPRSGGASGPLHPSSGRGYRWARPVGAHAGTQASQVARRIGAIPLLSLSLLGGGLVGHQPLRPPNCVSNQTTPVPTHMFVSSHLFRRFTLGVEIS